MNRFGRTCRASVFAFTALALGCSEDAQPTEEERILADVREGRGVVDLLRSTVESAGRVDAIGGFAYAAKGSRFLPGEATLPGAAPLGASDYTATVLWDAKNDRGRMEVARTLIPFGTLPPQSFTLTLSGNGGFITGGENVLPSIPSGNLTSDGAAAARFEQRLLNPHLLVRDVVKGERKVSFADSKSDNGETLVDLAISDDVAPIVARIRLRDRELLSLTTKTNNQVKRDIELSATFGGWSDAAGIKAPREVALAEEGQSVAREMRESFAIDPAIDDGAFVAPPGAPPFDRAAWDRGKRNVQWHQQMASWGLRFTADGLQTIVAPLTVSPGVTLLTGGSHHSLVVEQSQGIVVLEAPLYEERSEAVLAFIKATYPTKPVTHVFATHWHDDHAGGIRRFAAEGATVVVSELTKAFFEEVLAAPSTILPDYLSRNPKTPKILTVPAGGMTLDDAERPIRLVPLKNSHASDMIGAYLPRQRVLFEADLYSPPLPPFPNGWSRELHDAVVAAQLDVETIAGAHGATGTYQGLVDIVRSTQ